MNLYKKYNYRVVKKDEEEYRVDKIVSKKLFSHIKNFLNNKNNNNNNNNINTYKRRLIKNKDIKKLLRHFKILRY